MEAIDFHVDPGSGGSFSSWAWYGWFPGLAVGVGGSFSISPGQAFFVNLAQANGGCQVTFNNATIYGY